MIKEIKQKTKIAKEIVFQCDHCNKIFVKDYQSFQVNKLHHFCSRKCAAEEKKNGGIINLKTQAIWLETYGVSNVFQNHNIKKNIKNTMLKNYGVENCSQLDSVKLAKKNTCLENFGVDVPLKSSEIMEKYKNTFINTYGVINPSQVPSFFNKAQENMRGAHKTGYVNVVGDNIFYRSSYEELFLLSVKDMTKNYSIFILPNVKIDYTHNNKSRKYFADYLITANGRNILFEIKPEKLISTPLNNAKFAAAKKFIQHHDIDDFVVLSEKDLFDPSFKVEKFFGEFYE